MREQDPILLLRPLARLEIFIWPDHSLASGAILFVSLAFPDDFGIPKKQIETKLERGNFNKTLRTNICISETVRWTGKISLGVITANCDGRNLVWQDLPKAAMAQSDEQANLYLGIHIVIDSPAKVSYRIE